MPITDHDILHHMNMGKEKMAAMEDAVTDFLKDKMKMSDEEITDLKMIRMTCPNKEDTKWIYLHMECEESVRYLFRKSAHVKNNDIKVTNVQSG